MPASSAPKALLFDVFGPHQHGDERGPAMGLRVFRGAVAPVQARSRDLSGRGLLGLKAAACRGHAASVRALTRNVSSLVSAIEWSSTTEELR